MQPETGEIWRWHKYYVLLLNRVDAIRFRCMIISEVGHGKIEIWNFEEIKNWERIA